MNFLTSRHTPLSRIWHGFSLGLIIASSAWGQTTYYVSSSTGDDSSNGTSTATPWKTPMRVRFTAYNPGDSILFRRGDSFEGQIVDTLIGTSSSPVVIGAYGTGNRPILYGDLRGRNWTATAGHPNIYQMYIGPGSEILTSYYQFFDGAWTLSTGPVLVRGSNPATWSAWLAALGEGQQGVALGRDTLFIHLWGNADPRTMGKDSLRIYRYANKTLPGSNNYIIQDLDVRNYLVGFLAAGSNGWLHNLHAQANIYNGLNFNGATDGLMESCTIDSTSDTGLYVIASLRCVVKKNIITNAGLVIVDGFQAGGIDRAGIGILDHYSAAQTGSGFNSIDSNLIYNCFTSFIDTYFLIGDSVRYNEGHAGGGGIFPHGTDLVISHNNLTMRSSGGNGGNFGQTRNGNITFTNNVLDSVKDYGIQVSFNDSGGTFTINNNTIRMIIPARSFVDYRTTGITSTDNIFYGVDDRWTSNGVHYFTLEAFQTATGYEAGSVWYSSANAPSGTFTVTPDTLPEGGGIVTLQWTSALATTATISYKVGGVDTVINVNTNGSTTVNISATTTFVLTLTAPLGTTQLTAQTVVKTTAQEFFLAQNYPNPFNTSTSITYGLPKDDVTSVKIYDSLGREIETLVEGLQTAGTHVVTWAPKGIASGIYRCRINSGSFSKTIRIVLLR